MLCERLSWDDLKLLLAAERAGSLNALAAELGMDPTTASRRMKAVEGAVGLSLFIRTHGGLRLTNEGRELFVHARAMEKVAHDFGVSVENLRSEPAGVVRISAPSVINRALIAPRIGEFCDLAPRVLVELNTDSGNVRLENWEADIAVRLGTLREVNDVLIARKLGVLEYAVFEPAEVTQRIGWISYSDQYSHLPEATYVRQAMSGAAPVFSSNDCMAMAMAVAAGKCRAVLPVFFGRTVPGIVQSGAPVLDREIWALRHRETGETSSVSTTYKWIVSLFAENI